MWICQCTAYFKFIPSTCTHSHSLKPFEDSETMGLKMDIVEVFFPPKFYGCCIFECISYFYTYISPELVVCPCFSFRDITHNTKWWPLKDGKGRGGGGVYIYFLQSIWKWNTNRKNTASWKKVDRNCTCNKSGNLQFHICTLNQYIFISYFDTLYDWYS